MALCSWCLTDMATALSCTVDAFHRGGVRIPLPPHRSEPDWPSSMSSCGDCGVAVGGWHHPGCDLQRCPVCHRQLLSCGCRFDEDDRSAEPLGVDGNGGLTERVTIGGTEVIVHHDDVPPGELTVVQGIPCTTALRTVIDLAPELEPQRLDAIVRDCLHRQLFTLDEAHRRLSQPDMVQRAGAHRVRALLEQCFPWYGGPADC